MNLIIKGKIRINPDSINKMKSNKINDEFMEYAIKCGYKFDSSQFFRFIKYPSYRKFVLNDDMGIKYLKHSVYDSKIYELLFNSDIRKFCDFYGDILLDKDPSLFSNIDKEKLYEYIVNNYSLDRVSNNYLKDNTFLIMSIKKYGLITTLKNYNNMIDKEKLDIIEEEIINNSMFYLEELDNIENILQKSNCTLNSSEFIQKLKNNPVFVNNIPEFLKNNNEYLVACVLNNPLNMIKFDKYVDFTDEEINIFVEKVKNNNIVFDRLPSNLYDLKILKAILESNVYLIDSYKANTEVAINLVIDIIENSNYKVNNNTPNYLLNSSKILLYSLEKDFSNIMFFNDTFDFTDDELRRIYDLYKSQDKIVYSDSILLQKNPFIMYDELVEGNVDIKDIDFSKIDNYYIVYAKFDKYKKDNNIDIELPIPVIPGIENKNGIYKVNTVEDIEKIMCIRDSYNYDKNEDIVFEIDQDSRIIPENIEFFKKLYQKNNNIYFNFVDNISLKTVLEGEEFLDYCVKDIVSANYSNFEKYVAVYDIVKRFKEYKMEKTDDKIDNSYSQSRAIHAILNNEYLVCVGFSNLTIDLLHRVGIEAEGLSLSEREHRITKVTIDDDKYDIHGTYISDATNDNDSVYSYKNMIFTNDEYVYDRYLKSYSPLIEKSTPVPPHVQLEAINTVKKNVFKGLSEDDWREYRYIIIEHNKWDKKDDICKLEKDKFLLLKKEKDMLRIQELMSLPINKIITKEDIILVRNYLERYKKTDNDIYADYNLFNESNLFKIIYYIYIDKDNLNDYKDKVELLRNNGFVNVELGVDHNEGYLSFEYVNNNSELTLFDLIQIIENNSNNLLSVFGHSKELNESRNSR